MENKQAYIKLVEETLLCAVVIRSEDPHNPIEVKYVPKSWECIGTGNYAAVFLYEEHDDWAVKIYARDTEGLIKEAQVYKRLGFHPAYSELIHQGDTYLILRRLKGVTLYEAFHKGIRISESVIQDINQALDYARKRGLNPFDVHGKNVMMKDGKGYVVDISDFYKEGEDRKWKDLVWAYYKIYKPFFYKHPIPIPYFILDIIRHSYRLYRRFRKK
ncbi:MAG: serine/threonine protein kinase [Ectobacillus sp.]